MPNKSKALSTAKNSLKQQLQLKVIEWNAVKDLFEEQSNSNENLSILRETLDFMRSQKEHLTRICCELMKLQLTSGKLTKLANETVERNITIMKCKQREGAHRTVQVTLNLLLTHQQRLPLITEKTVTFTQ